MRPTTIVYLKEEAWDVVGRKYNIMIEFSMEEKLKKQFRLLAKGSGFYMTLHRNL